MQDEQIYTAVKKNGEIQFYELKRSVSVPIKSLAPEYVLYQNRSINVMDQDYELKSVAMNNKVIHFLHGNIIFNHMAPINEAGMISSEVPVEIREQEDGATKYFYREGELSGEEVDNVNLMLRAVMCFELVNGKLAAVTFMHENGKAVNLYNVSNGTVCTGAMPETDNPSRLLATIMQNKGNFDHSNATQDFKIEEHQEYKSFLAPQELRPGRYTDLSDIWLEIK